MRPSRLHPTLTVFVLAVAAGACRSREDAPAPPAAASAAIALSEPDSCRGCHADVVARFEGSAHRLAARRLPAATRASFVSDAAVSDGARDVMSLRPASSGAGATLLVADPSGAMEERALSHVMGGIRREDYLSPQGGREQLLPVSWSVTRGAWVHPLAEELGGPIEAGSPLQWTTPRRSHENACSRCHPLPAEDAAAGTSSGIACATCHGDATAHVAKASGQGDATTWARDTMRRQVDDPWRGCAGCHAGATDRPRVVGLTEDAPFADRFLPLTFAGPGGLDRQFRLDGTPAVAHGMEVQSLATSPCFVQGGATCTTCHDPHGGEGASLKIADPDASCRSCHAAIAPEHAGHPVATTPVPSSRQEPGGPAAGRLPGCVDCHAPALLPFGKGDLARDHAIGVPSPELDAAAGIVSSCVGCHADMTADALQKSMPVQKEARARERRLLAFRLATTVAGPDDGPRVVKLLTQVVADPKQDAWSRASAAHLLAAGGSGASGAVPALEAAWTTATDPALVLAAANAHARVGGAIPALKTRLDAEKDWRIALAMGGGLAARGEARGLEVIESIYGDARVPEIARADAGSDLAVVLIQQGSCRRAASVLADALSKKADSVPGWLNMGVARACLGDAPGAREAFTKVLALQPDHDLARRNLASLDEAEAAKQE